MLYSLFLRRGFRDLISPPSNYTSLENCFGIHVGNLFGGRTFFILGNPYSFWRNYLSSKIKAQVIQRREGGFALEELGSFFKHHKRINWSHYFLIDLKKPNWHAGQTLGLVDKGAFEEELNLSSKNLKESGATISGGNVKIPWNWVAANLETRRLEMGKYKSLYQAYGLKWVEGMMIQAVSKKQTIEADKNWKSSNSWNWSFGNFRIIFKKPSR